MTTAIRRKRTVTQARLFLVINETSYSIRRSPCDPLAGEKAYQLQKPDGTSYDVVQTCFGPECDCPDFVFRREGIDPDGCKHVKALVAYGLIEGPHVDKG